MKITKFSLISPLNQVPFHEQLKSMLREAVGDICDERGISKWRIKEFLIARLFYYYYYSQ